jgi:chromate transporter
MLWPTSVGQVAAIALGALTGILALGSKRDDTPVDMRLAWSKVAGAISLVLFFALLIGLPLARAHWDSHVLALFDSFYRSGSLVFGGGHVVLPLLQAEVVPPGWTTNDAFLAGYGAAQAVPGPLFTFAAYLGTVMTIEPNGWQGAMHCIAAIFLPGILLTNGALPFWHELRAHAPVRSALVGINAAVVGLLLAALYHPVWTSAIRAPSDFGLGLAAFALLAFWKVPPWLVVVLSALAGWGIAAAR